MTWQQYLTEKVLEETCGHEDRPWFTYPCPKCSTRTFTTPKDLHDVYSAVEREGRTDELRDYLGKRWVKEKDSAWKFIMCLNGKPEDFEARCKMVAEWHGWEEEI